MNTTLLLLKHLIPALEAFRYEMEEDEAKRAAAKARDPTGVAEPKSNNQAPSLEPPGKKVLNLAEVSTMLGMCKLSLYKLTSQRGIPFFKIGSRLLFDEQKLRAWMETHAVEPLAAGRPSRVGPRTQPQRQ